MTVLGAGSQEPSKEEPEKKEAEAQREEEKSEKDDIFSSENLPNDSVVGTASNEDGKKEDEVEISHVDKALFIDSVAKNERFTKDYVMFGGKLKFTLRSLTIDEVNALSIWSVKQGTIDPAGIVSGKYRKYLLAAHVAMIDGMEIPPLVEPLFERIGKDGKSVEEPGWLHQADFCDGMAYGKFQAILNCIGKFDKLYSTLCSKAEDSNFWVPDTP